MDILDLLESGEIAFRAGGSKAGSILEWMNQLATRDGITSRTMR